MTNNPTDAAMKAVMANTTLTVAKSNLRDLLGRQNAPLELLEAHIFELSNAITAARNANSERDAAAALAKAERKPIFYTASSTGPKRGAQFASSM